MKLFTEATETVLLGARLPEGTTSFQVPDNMPCFNAEQMSITTNAKALYGATEAKSTFKLVEKNGERNIYEPSVMNKDGVISVQWGEMFIPVDKAAVTFDGYAGTITAGDEEAVSLKVRILNIKPEDAKTETQKTYSKLAKDQRGAFLNTAWKKGTIVELLAEGYPTVLKLSDVKAGVYKAVAFKMGGFDKYIIQLEDGCWLRANTSLQGKLADYDELGVVVSKEKPATLTIDESTATTSKGYPIFPVRLTSFANSNIEVFDFTKYTSAAS